MALNEQEIRVARAAAREHFEVFAAAAFSILEPGVKLEWNWHLSCICQYLQAVFDGVLKRLIINIPPRFMKSMLISIIFPAWAMGRNPSEKFIVASHTMEPLATKLGRDTLRLMNSDWYKDVFPNVVLNKETATELETDQNGGRMAVSANKGFTGAGFTIGIIDDPNKPDEALSDVIRNSTNEWVDNTFMSRMNDRRTGRIILVMQRLHENDVTGYLLAKGGYTLLKLPVEAHEDITYTIRGKTYAMKAGDLLHPTRVTPEVIEELQRDMGSYNFAGQYMQNPVPIGGGMFKAQWIKYYDRLNPKFTPRNMNVFILCDPAGVGDVPGQTKKRKKSDWTAYQVVGLAPDNNYYLLDMVRDKFNPTERYEALFDLHRHWNKLCGRPPKVGYESYGLQSDLHHLQKKMDEDNYRFTLIPLGGKMSKPDRISRLIPDMEAGQWYFPQSISFTDTRGITYDLVQEMVKGEMLTFPVSKHDDCLDALSRIYDDELNARMPKLAGPAGMPTKQTGWVNF